MAKVVGIGRMTVLRIAILTVSDRSSQGKREDLSGPALENAVIEKIEMKSEKKGILLRANYYTALLEDQEYSPLRPLVDWLDYNGYTLVTKPTKEFTDSKGEKKIKGNMDMELAIDMMGMADHVDHMVLFSGDGDFRSLVEAVQRKGVRVTVVSSTRTNPSMIADELRRQADNFIEISEMNDEFARPSNGNHDGHHYHEPSRG